MNETGRDRQQKASHFHSSRQIDPRSMSERETEIHKQEEEENLPCFDANLAAAAPPSWTSLLNAARKDDQEESCFSQVQAHFQHFSRQISLYGQAVKNKQDDPSSKNLTKELIVETRAALRFATVWSYQSRDSCGTAR